MSQFIILAVILFSINVYCEELYDTKYDNFDIDAVLKSDRLLTNYFKCVMEGTGCTKEGNLLKKVLPELIMSECQKCNAAQKKMGLKVISFLLNKRLDIWKKLMDKYDPDGKRREEYEKKYKGSPISD